MNRGIVISWRREDLGYERVEVGKESLSEKKNEWAL